MQAHQNSTEVDKWLKEQVAKHPELSPDEMYKFLCDLYKGERLSSNMWPNWKQTCSEIVYGVAPCVLITSEIPIFVCNLLHLKWKGEVQYQTAETRFGRYALLQVSAGYVACFTENGVKMKTDLFHNGTNSFPDHNSAKQAAENHYQQRITHYLNVFWPIGLTYYPQKLI